MPNQSTPVPRVIADEFRARAVRAETLADAADTVLDELLHRFEPDWPDAYVAMVERLRRRIHRTLVDAGARTDKPTLTTQKGN